MSPTPKYIYDMPYSEREKICRLLDLDGHWKILGGLMGLKTDDIHYMEHEERLGLRPTNQLLKKWGQQNHTVQELFYLLYEMKHSQAMVVLKGFVDESHHKLIYEGKSLTELVKGSNNCSGRQSSAIGNAPASAQHPDVSENFRGLNLNVMLPEPLKLNKPGFADSDKIQNIGKTVSVEANIAPSQSPESAYLHPVHAPNVVNEVLKQPHLSRAGAAAVSSAGPSNIGKDLVVTTPRRKLSDVSLSSIQNECVLPMLDYRELEIATNYWSASNILGRGGFGTVYKGVWKNTDVAIKRIELQKGESQDSQEVSYQQSLRELQALQRYHHKNILQLYGLSLKFGSQPCLIYQFMENGSLEDRLQCRNKTTPLTWSQRNNIAKGAARGLQFLHTVEKQPLIHGDIKSANILLDVNFEPRIGDFGLAREGPQTHYTHMKVSKVHGTRPYLPDEYIRSKTLSKKVDTYSFGVVLFELATGLRAYDEKRTWKYLREEVMNSKNELELMDRKAKADFTSSRSQRGDITNLSVQSIDSRILEGLLIFLRLMNAGKKCVSKLPCNRPQMEDVCQTLDQQTSAVEVTPLALQELHDKIRDFRDRCGSRSQAHSGQPLSSVPLAPSQPSPVVSINTPGQAASQINSPTDLNEQNCVARHISNISTINRPSASGLSTYHHQSPPGDPNGSAKAVNGTLSPTGVELPIMLAFGTPSIAVMPPTASDVSTISTLSSQSESSIFISHDCHPTSSALSKKVESSLEEPGPEILPLLTILGNKSFSDAEDVPEQSSSSKAPHDSMSSSSSSSS